MRAALVIALLVPLAAWADGMPETPPPNEVLEYWSLGGKSDEQVHSPILVYNQPFRVEMPARNEEAKKKAASAAFSVSMGGLGGGSSSGSSGSRSPQRTSPRQASQPDKDAPVYGGPGDVRAATMDSGRSRSTNPCSKSGYHDNVMSHGLDTARTKCELHQLDKNRWQLWALSGGDPLMHYTMEKQLDKGLDLFNVPK